MKEINMVLVVNCMIEVKHAIQLRLLYFFDPVLFNQEIKSNVIKKENDLREDKI